MSAGVRTTFAEMLVAGDPIEIPIIQRDYVQGRDAVSEIRDQFLDSLYRQLSISESELLEPLDLDFVYGSLSGGGRQRFLPLDGQQRLTTLFLLHWYLSCLDRRHTDFSRMVMEGEVFRFTYQTRPSSTEFLQALACEDIDFSDKCNAGGVRKLSATLQDRPWFFLSWRQDPTVQSCMGMLDAIHDKFRHSCGFFGRLLKSDRPYITFQLLNLKDFGLTDELYIKMNAWGKPLTPFENFKARLEQYFGVIFKDANRQYKGKVISERDYFSHQIDTLWADLFWPYRDSQTNGFDEQAMNFIRSVIEVYFPTEVEDWRDGLSAIRNPAVDFSFQRYLEFGCLTPTVLSVLVRILDFVSDPRGGLRIYIGESAYFDELASFKKVIARIGRTGLDYEASVQFFAYCKFIERCEGEIDRSALSEWMRVIANLSLNTVFNDIEEFQRALLAVKRLSDRCHDILVYLAERNPDERIEGFLGIQVREEQVKARLIRKSVSWRDLVIRAEIHKYFKGQIGFLLDFSGISAYVADHGDVEWSDQEDVRFFNAFREYLEKAFAVFGDEGLVKLEGHLWERALLTKGDYTLSLSRNQSFLIDNDRDISWKRLLRDEVNNSKRYFVKQVLNEISVADVTASLRSIIDSSPIIDDWRQMVISHPEVIDYCGKRFIRHTSNRGVILLSKKKTSSLHCELFLYNLMLELRSANGKGSAWQSIRPYSYMRLNDVAAEEESAELMLLSDTAEVPVLRIRFIASGFFIKISGYGEGAANTELKDRLIASNRYTPILDDLVLMKVSPSYILTELGSLFSTMQPYFS